MNTSWTTILLFIVLLGSVNCSAAADPLLERVRGEVRPAMARVEAFYDQVRGKCRRTQTAGKNTIRWKISFAADHGLRKASVLWDDDGADRANQRSETVYALGAKYAFRIRRSGDKPYLLLNLGPPDSEDAHLNLSKIADKVLFAPCGIWGFPMSALMAHPTFQITSTEKVLTTKGEQQVRIAYRLDHPYVKSGSILVAPDHCWAIQHADCQIVMGRGMGKTTLLCKTEYGPSRDGIPIPVRVNYSIDPSSDDPATVRYDVDEIVSGPTPEAEFTLAYYGLPEPGEPKRSRGYLWVALVGILCLGLAAVFRWKARRAERAAAPPRAEGP